MSSERFTQILLGVTAALAVFALVAAVASPNGAPSPVPVDLRDAPSQVALEVATATPTRVPEERYARDPGGLAYLDLRVGTGKIAATGDGVKLRWRTWTPDDRLVEDGSAHPPRPLTLGATRNLGAFNVGVEGMREGGLRQWRVPAALAYGQAGSSRLGIPADTELIYEVELVQVIGARVVPDAPLPVSYQKLPSGLEIFDFSEGNGPTPAPGDTVVVDYTGWLEADGSVFDSSMRRPDPTTLQVGAVISGWNEALTTMKVGGHRQLRVPAALGYGTEGRPPLIPPDSTLIFDLTLLDRR